MADLVRIVLDEDLPPGLAEHLRARGLDAVAVNELRRDVWSDKRRITDTEVCAEVARVPSVLLTINIRDYADLAFIKELVEQHKVSVAIVRVPKAETGIGKRPQAIHDIVHRHAHRLPSMFGEEPVVASVNRRGLRLRTLAEIQEESRRQKDAKESRKRLRTGK